MIIFVSSNSHQESATITPELNKTERQSLKKGKNDHDSATYHFMLLFSQPLRRGETAQGRIQGHLLCICHLFGTKKKQQQQVFNTVIFT